MKFSIITVCRNDADALERTIQSIAEQDYSDWEYIIVDGESSDRTPNIIAQAMEAGIVHRFVSGRDDGIYDAMNKGITLATGDVVYFLNADDLFADHFVLKDVAQFWQEHPESDFLYGKINVVAQGDGAITTIDYPSPDKMLDHLMFGWVCHQAMFARLSLFQTIGHFDDQFRIAADYDWLFRAIKHNTQLVYLPRPIANYRLGGLSDTDQVQSISEMFTVQNQFPPYQESSWLAQRVLKLQSVILQLKNQEKQQQDQIRYLQQQQVTNPTVQQELRLKLKQTRQNLQQSYQDCATMREEIEAMKIQLREKEEEIIAMKTSKFWQVRSLWHQLKYRLNLSKNN